MISIEDRLIVEKIKALLLEKDVPLVDMIVFGSRARGDADEESDLDLFIVVSHIDKQIKEKIGDCCWEIGFDENIIIQDIVMTEDEAYNSPQRSSLLLMAVRRDGIKI